jgi:hypothetical protein
MPDTPSSFNGKINTNSSNWDFSPEEINLFALSLLVFRIFRTILHPITWLAELPYKLFPLSKEHNKIYQYTIVLPYNENSILSSDGLESKEEVRHVRTIEDKRLTKSLVLPK